MVVRIMFYIEQHTLIIQIFTGKFVVHFEINVLNDSHKSQSNGQIIIPFRSYNNH